MFGNKKKLEIKTDIHSHLVPGVDDGVNTTEEAIDIIRQMESLGYQKIITTPHISENYYPQNTPDLLRESFEPLVDAVSAAGLSVELVLGAEYLVDARLLKILEQEEEILSWNGFVLIETPFHNWPMIFDQVIFQIQARGWVPVLAHPERYSYLNLDQLQEIVNKGTKLQVTAGSFGGKYGSVVKTQAVRIVKAGLAHFIGSDVHNHQYLTYLHKGLQHRALTRSHSGRFLNDQLM